MTETTVIGDYVYVFFQLIKPLRSARPYAGYLYFSVLTWLCNYCLGGRMGQTKEQPGMG